MFDPITEIGLGLIVHTALVVVSFSVVMIVGTTCFYLGDKIVTALSRIGPRRVHAAVRG